jgi:TolA-binding protein
MKFYLETFSDSPNVAEVLFMLGKLYEEEKDYPEAFTSYLKLKLIEPGSKRVTEVVPIIQQIITDKAERTFKDKRAKIEEFMNKQISFSDRNSAYSEYLSFLYDLDIEDINEILVTDIKSYLNIYSQEAKNLEQIIFWQAELFEKSKDWDEAVAAYAKVKHIVPDSPIMAKTIFKIAYLQYEETKQYQEAKTNFTDVISNYSESESAGDAQFYLAEMYEEKLDNTQEALTNYRLLVESYPKHKYSVQALKRVAEINEDGDKYQEAINSYHQIFELYPENNYAPEALLEIESLYRRKLKNYQKSIEVLKLYATQYSSREDAAERLFDAADLHWDELG